MVSVLDSLCLVDNGDRGVVGVLFDVLLTHGSMSLTLFLNFSERNPYINGLMKWLIIYTRWEKHLKCILKFLEGKMSLPSLPVDLMQL